MALGYKTLQSTPTFATRATAPKSVISPYSPGGTYGTNTSKYPVNVLPNPAGSGTPWAGKVADDNYGLPVSGGSQGGQSGGGASYFSRPSFDWQNDPGYMATMALTAQSRTAAEQQKNDALRKQILASGLDVMASKLFPQDEAFIKSVKDNPFGLNQEIAHAYEGQTGKINQANEAMNADNLFFSSYRTGQQLPEIYRQRQSDEYDLTNKTQGAIDTVNAAYANKLQELQMQEIQAQQTAWMNAMQMGAYGGYGPGGGGGGDQFNALGQVTSDPGTGVGRPGEWADLPVLKGWDPNKNSDAVYDMTNATPVAGGYIGPNGQRYDDHGRVV